MAGSKERAIETFNSAIELSSAQYKAAVKPATMATDVQEAFKPLVQYAGFMNEWLTYVLNKIIFQEVESRSYTNKYTMLKKEGFPLGTDMEYNYINPATAREYSVTLGDTLLNRIQPDVKTVYFRRNRKQQYPVTIPEAILTGAVTSWGMLDDFVTGTIRSLFSGNQIDEERLVMKLLLDSVKYNVIKTMEIDYPMDTDPSQAALNLLKASNALSLKFTFAGSDYNNYEAYAKANGINDATPAITWVENSDLVIFIDSDALINAKFEVLAGAFNLNQVDMKQRIIPVNGFKYVDPITKKVEKNDDLIAIVSDRKTYGYHDNLTRSSDFMNAAGLYANHYLTVFQTYTINPCGNCIAIKKKTD